ncbi:uncharacterized protein LOC128550950 [Mercenaria mercenaria]|uniref:uncharacterized protein LOC128550950 n=1 Tax=Mercenaria mercenaria TaxID=6596 RepID=UPI00234E7796|nr:uncharacterized protein LOC128550950 [Mercenaria mercenaria]
MPLFIKLFCRTFPRILSHGRNAGNFRDFDTPHFKGSLPNIMHADAYIYRGDQRRYSFQEKRRYSSYDQDRNVDTDLNFEGNRMSLRHEIERPPSPLPDYNRMSNVDRGGIQTNGNRRSGHFDEFGAPIKF